MLYTKILFGLGSFWHGLKKKIVGDKIIDEKAAEHKEQFTALVREIKNVFRHDGLLLSLTVLPNVNSSGEFLNSFLRKSLMLFNSIKFLRGLVFFSITIDFMKNRYFNLSNTRLFFFKSRKNINGKKSQDEGNQIAV